MYWSDKLQPVMLWSSHVYCADRFRFENLLSDNITNTNVKLKHCHFKTLSCFLIHTHTVNIIVTKSSVVAVCISLHVLALLSLPFYLIRIVILIIYKMLTVQKP